MHLVPTIVTELGLKFKGANFIDDLFIIFENCFLFSKVRRTKFFFFFLKNTENIKNNKFKEQVKF